MTSCVSEPNRIIWRNHIEISGSHVAVLTKFSFIPTRTVYPFARFGRSNRSLHPTNNFRDGGGIRKLDAVEFVNASIGNMGMRVDKARCCRMALEVDDANASSVAGKFQDFGVGAVFHNYAVADRGCLRHRVLRVDGKNVAVKQKRVSGLCSERLGRQGSEEQEGEYTKFSRIN